MNEHFADRLRYCTALPSLPAVAIRIIDLANNPDTNMAQISDQVALDPALATKFLKVAASPLFRSRRATTNVRQAVSLLGTHGAIMLALSFSLSQSFQQIKDKNVDSLYFWRRAILSALASRILGEKLGRVRLDELFLAGLLQDVGLLIMDVVAPDEYAEIFSYGLTKEDLLKAERKVFGTGHDEVGYWLLQNWKLPKYLALACLARSDLSWQNEDGTNMMSCIAVSSYIADSLLAPDDNQETVSTAAEISKKLLGLDRNEFDEVLEKVNASLAGTAELFNIPLQSKADICAIMSEAKDLQLLRNLNKSGELEGYSQRDALTGAHNRGYFDVVLQREFDLATRHCWPLSVAMLDLDHFKSVNDNHGHSAGDSVLISVVRAVQSQLRPDDIFARYGGEEFVLILPGTSLDFATRLLTRLKESIAETAHVQQGSRRIVVTTSIGVAVHMDQGVQFASAEEMMQAVDRALYAAKEAGRNHIEIWNAERTQS